MAVTTCRNDTYAAWNPTYASRQTIGSVVLVAGTLLCIVGVSAFLWRRREHPLRARSASLVLLSSAGCLITMLARVAFEEYMTSPEMPCDVAFVAGMSFPIFAGVPQLLRIIRLYHMYKVQRRKAGFQSNGDRHSRFRMQRAVRKEAMWTNPCRLNAVFVAASMPSIVSMVILYMVDDQIGNGCVNCGNTWPDLYVNVCIGVMCAGLSGWAMYRTRRIVDSFSLRKEIVHWAITWSIILVVTLPMEVLPVFRDLEREGWFNGGSLLLAGAFASFIISVVLPTLATFDVGPYAFHSGLSDGGGIRRSASSRSTTNETVNPIVDGHSSKRDTSGASRGHAIVAAAGTEADTEAGQQLQTPATVLHGKTEEEVELIDVLTNPLGFRLFTEHLTTEFSVENSKFWADVNFFRDHFHAGEPGRVAASIVFEVFVDEAAPLAVNVSSSQREAVQGMLGDASSCSATMFDECQEEIYKLMERDS